MSRKIPDNTFRIIDSLSQRTVFIIIIIIKCITVVRFVRDTVKHREGQLLPCL